MGGDPLKAQFSRAVADYARRVIAVLGWPGTGPEFSGVCIVVGGEHFLVTAAHCLEGRDASGLHIATMKESHAAVPLGPLQGRCFDSQQTDMAAFHISPDVASSLPVDWIKEHRLASSGAEPGELVCVAGFPSKMVDLGTRSGTVQKLYMNALILVSKVATWPREVTGLAPPPTPDVDFFVDFRPSSFLDESGQNLSIPDSVLGLSGSPVFWVPRAEGTALWSVEGVTLAGIQISHLRIQNMLRVQRIEPVQKLIRSCLGEEGAIA